MSNQDIIDLKNAGVSEKVIETMIETKAVAKKDSAVVRYWYPRDYRWYAGYYWPGYYWYLRTYRGTSIYVGVITAAISAAGLFQQGAGLLADGEMKNESDFVQN